LRRLATKRGKASEPGALFAELAGGQDEISEERFGEIMAMEDSAILPEQVQLAFKQLAPHGLVRQCFALALADYRKVVRDISLTSEFGVKSDRIRKLVRGELLEVTGAPRADTGLSLERLQCRVLQDGSSGWVTIQSNAGAAYIEKTEKPFMWCAQDAGLLTDADASGSTIRSLRTGEVVELLQGPCEGPASSLLVQGAKRDGTAAGWLQVREDHKSLVEPSPNFFRCNDAVAMTDVAEVAQCRMLRRIDAGEVLEVLTDAEVQSSKGGKRRRFRAITDGMEGWVTTQGNQGTAYVINDPRHLVCKGRATVYKELSLESPVLEMLEPGEVFMATDEPQELPGGEKLSLYHVRTTLDYVEGWVAQTKEEPLQPWRRQYEVLRTLAITRNRDTASDELRSLEVRELVEVVDHPVVDEGTEGRLRARCVAMKDGLVGWATVTEGTGHASSLSLRPAPLSMLPPPPADDSEDPLPPEVTSKAAAGCGKAGGKAGRKLGGKGVPRTAPSSAVPGSVPWSSGSGAVPSAAPSSSPGARTQRVAPSAAPSALPPPPPAPAASGGHDRYKGSPPWAKGKEKGKGKDKDSGKGKDGFKGKSKGKHK